MQMSIRLSIGVTEWAGGVLALTIIDDYIGAGLTNPNYSGKDAIGAEEWFDVTGLM